MELKGKINSPKEIVDGCIKQQQKYLQGFKGTKKTNLEKFDEAMKPLHFAISLTGEVTYYPYLPELVDEIHNRGMTSFIVTNGTNPEMLRKLINKSVTQLYITLPAPNKKVFEEVCRPLIKNAWERIQESLSLMNHFKRPTIRLTLVKRMNMLDPEGFAEMLNKTDFKFLEVKAGMAVGYARYRMEYSQMPLHKDMVEFAKKLAKICNLKIIDEKKESRVVLLMKEDKERKINFQNHKLLNNQA